MNTTILISGIIILCIVLALILLLTVFRSRSRSVPNHGFHMPESRNRVQDAKAFESADQSAPSGKHHWWILIGAVLLAAAAAVIVLNAAGFFSGLLPGQQQTDAALTMDSQLLYSGNDVCIYATSIDRTDTGWDIMLSIENSSVLNLSFNAHSFAINGIMTHNNIFDMDCDVSAGSRASIQLKLDDSVMDAYSIEDVRCVDIIFWAYNSDTYLKVFDTDQVEIRTSLYDGVHDSPGGTTVYADSSVSVDFIGSSADTYSFCITDLTDHYLCFDFTNIQINGYNLHNSDSSLQDVTLLSGCKILCSLTVESAFLQQNNLSAVSTIAWQLSIRPEDDASESFQTEMITYHTGIASDPVPETTETYTAEPENTTVASPIGPFLDTDASDYYADALVWAYENGITSGTSDTTFSPDLSCTRAQIVTFLWRAAGSPETWSMENPFTDVTETDSFYEPVLWALENGITSGTSESTFSPDQQITRSAMLLFLWRMAGSPTPGITVSDCPFQDITDSDPYLDAVLWSVENNIVTGTDSRTFAAAASVSRAQAVTMIYRFFQLTTSVE